MGSKRLPGKVLMKLENKPILEHITNFLGQTNMINENIIATTILKEDDKIKEFAKGKKIKYFRGSSENVLERYYKCAKGSNADIIVRITADDPIIEPSLIDKIILECKNCKLDYASNVIEKSFPIGYTTCEVFTFETLSKLYHEQKGADSLEHVTYHIRKNPKLFKIKSITTSKKLERSHWRLTVDHKQDLLLMKEIFSKMYSSERAFEYNKLVDFLDNNPKLLKINSECK